MQPGTPAKDLNEKYSTSVGEEAQTYLTFSFVSLLLRRSDGGDTRTKGDFQKSLIALGILRVSGMPRQPFPDMSS